MTVQELGWADTDYSSAFATANIVAGLVGMFIGGALVDFFGKVRMMKIFLGAILTVVLAMALLSPLWGKSGVVFAFIMGFYVLEVCFTVAVFATAMQLCWKRVAATQFTLYMAVSNLGLSVGAAMFGQLSRFFSSSLVILAYLAFASFSLAMLRFVRLERHDPEVERLEGELTAPATRDEREFLTVMPLDQGVVPERAG